MLKYSRLTDIIYISFHAVGASLPLHLLKQNDDSLRLGNRLQRLDHDNTVSPDNLQMIVGCQHMMLHITTNAF
jgi:hypothetical protein